MANNQATLASFQNHETKRSDTPLNPHGVNRRVIHNVFAINRRVDAFRQCMPVCYRTEINQQQVTVMRYPSGRLEQIEIDHDNTFRVIRTIRK